MITDYKTYRDYCSADKSANKITRPFFVLSPSWTYLKCLRKVELLMSLVEKHRYLFPLLLISKYHLRRWSLKTGITLPPRTFGKGLYIPHYGSIVVNHTAHFGDYCVIQNGVNISEGVIGENHIYIGAGAKLLSDVYIASDVIIGANAVVTKSIQEHNIVVAGIPAKKISDRGFKNRTKV